MLKSPLTLIAPTGVIETVADGTTSVPLATNPVPAATDPEPAGTVIPLRPHRPPRRQPNTKRRSREYLTEAEVEKLIKVAAGINRHGHRDATMILVAFRHGLRSAELVALRWEQIDFVHGKIHVNRVKRGVAAVHPLSGRELRALRRLKRDQEPASPVVFTSERGAPFSTHGYAKLIERLGVAVKFESPLHPHMLRHACGYALANKGKDTRSLQAYLGHKDIRHTVRYTELSSTRFKDFWDD
jgi:type 1 fimbriae regulatory protein FimB/type 1 fimbriae regulatory protein FimE